MYGVLYAQTPPKVFSLFTFTAHVTPVYLAVSLRNGSFNYEKTANRLFSAAAGVFCPCKDERHAARLLAEPLIGLPTEEGDHAAGAPGGLVSCLTRYAHPVPRARYRPTLKHASLEHELMLVARASLFFRARACPEHVL